MKKQGLKNLIGKGSTGIVVTILVFVITIGAIMTVSNLTLAADSLPGIVDIRNEIQNDGVFTILEIVPDQHAAQFGYLVGGEEPLDVATLYNDTTKEWISWQKYLTDNIETMDETDRQQYLEQLATNLAISNPEYISIGSNPGNTPIWYEGYTEQYVTKDNASGVLEGGNTPVHGWLQYNTSAEIGWNAQFIKIDNDKTYTELMSESTPYYIVDSILPDSQVALDATSLATYPEYVYTYKKDVSQKFYISDVTIGELSEDIADDGLIGDGTEPLSDYYVLKFRRLVESDYAGLDVGPTVYMASNIKYEDTRAPYVIPEQPANEKGHSLTKPAKTVYYQGGFFSNEMFKHHTMNIDLAEVSNYKVDVQSVTAGDLNAYTREELATYLSSVDFVYINAGNTTYKYNHTDATLDLDLDAVELIFEKICNEKTPCIVDYYITSSTLDVTNTNVYALACMLMQSDYRGILSNNELDTSIISANLASWYASIDNINGYNFVNGNVMVIDSISNPLLSNYYDEANPYASDVVSEAYQAVLDEINLENLYRSADQEAGYQPLSTDIHKATVVRYIMNYISARVIETKKSIEVLEIQPANVKQPGNSETVDERGDTDLTPSRVRKWMGITDKSVTVNITTKNTTEFIGVIEDLNSEYDLIYIGADIAGMNRTENSGQYTTDYLEVTGYDSMDGLIYTNVGGLTGLKSQLSGHLDTDWRKRTTATSNGEVYYRTYGRYNGNDITPDKHNELVDYVKGTYPIVVSDKLLNNAKTGPTDTTVDDCTYLYSFLEKHMGDSNVFAASEVEDGKNETFEFYINRAKLDIGTKVIASDESRVTDGTAFVQPGIYSTELKESDPTNHEVTYVSDENGAYYLTYKFTITNNGAVYSNTGYTATLYLDSNSDGKFSEKYEKISDTTITHVASNKVVTNGTLIANEQYMLKRKVPDGYHGLLTWKVEVSQTSNTYIRDSVTGYTKLVVPKDDPNEKIVIKVLQVRRDGGTPLILEDAIGNSKGTGKNNTLSALVWGGKCNKDGKTYEGIADDYQFVFTTVTNKQFNERYDAGTLNLMSYDIVVLGFYDSYDLKGKSESDIEEDSVIGSGGLREYIDSGKSVLFAHDTTSVTIVPDYSKVNIVDSGGASKGTLYSSDGGASVWAYYLNTYIRDMVGLDTYGITLKTKDNVDYTPVKSGVDLSTTDAGKTLMAALKNNLDADGYYKIGLKPLAYLPNSGKTQTVGQTQGFLYGWMDYNWSSDSTDYRNAKTAYNTYKADKINEGAITTYPYYVQDKIDIARTHHQYFTLDFYTDDDKDGETDLVVWYTMGGEAAASTTSNFNTTSNKDVMNNYYIYNKGNITYTGFGDFNTEAYRDAATVVEECKLFVNTLVAAYNTGLKTPQVTVYDSAESLNSTNVFYEYGDVSNDMNFLENNQKMYFKIDDMNVLRGTKVGTVKYYVKLKPGNYGSTYVAKNSEGVDVTYEVIEHEGDNYINVTSQLETYLINTTTNDVDESNLTCGQIYYVKIPNELFTDIEAVSGQNTNSFLIRSQTILKKIGSVTGTELDPQLSPVGNLKVDYVHVELFPLD